MFLPFSLILHFHFLRKINPLTYVDFSFSDLSVSLSAFQEQQQNNTEKAERQANFLQRSQCPSY
jgi:hypothetical protein